MGLGGPWQESDLFSESSGAPGGFEQSSNTIEFVASKIPLAGRSRSWETSLETTAAGPRVAATEVGRSGEAGNIPSNSPFP